MRSSASSRQGRISTIGPTLETTYGATRFGHGRSPAELQAEVPGRPRKTTGFGVRHRSEAVTFFPQSCDPITGPPTHGARRTQIREHFVTHSMRGLTPATVA